ncbi:hypothetical protein H2198_004712 [Neophaeococcomyces mojaviensis]|uniref:Uncharacterized protein n=1 Tax=Neophaeococcomyces mojaviensis TaxID=3383035 RepID=A0ACC3A7X9_9EURO|nr:hypothetical protein H2198_004712 [Knufia sp. JES_112]
MCLDSALTQCTGGKFKTWLCRGGNNVQCCIKNGPNEAFVDYIRTLYQIAQTYQPTGSPNLRVMEWLRHKDYHGVDWWAILGSMDDAYFDLVERRGITMIESLNDSLYADVQLKISHMGACMNGAFLKGMPSGTTVNFADFTCWGGDLITFYAEWRRDVDEYPSGRQYALARLAKINVDSTFKLRDLLEDAWGWNMGMTLRSDTRLSIVDEMQKQLAPGGEYRTRIKRFVDDRFHGQMREVVKQMLVSTDDTKLAAARAALIELNTIGAKLPVNLPDADLNGFVDGVVSVIQDEVRSERGSWDE